MAWIILLRRLDIALDGHAVKWLTVVATREAWRQASLGHEVPAGAFQPPLSGETVAPRTEPEPAAENRDLDAHVIALEDHRRRVADLLALRPRERRELYLHARATATARSAS